MIHDGQELHVGVAHVMQIIRQLRRHLAVGNRAIAFFEDAFP
jgi:hypothetical protein